MIVILYISFLIYPFFSGWKDGVLWSKKAYDAYPWDEHKILIGERIGVSISLILTLWFAYNHWITLEGFSVAAGCGIASFFFIHNGMYYQARQKIDNAYAGWADDSKTSSSWLNVPFWLRLILFISSPPIVLCYEYYF